ncbi:MAG TPA: hypothetical protein VGM79_09505 [Streptosporangiaceae bacterium]|jgi:hypothetical protein
MYSKRLVLLSAAAATAVSLAGCAPAGAGHRPSPPPAAARTVTAASGPAASRAQAGGTVQFVDYQDNDGPRAAAVLTGAIGDYGPAVSVHPDGTTDPDHDSQLKLVLARGSFRLSIARLDAQLVAVFRHFPPDRATCSGTVTVTGAVPVVAGSGTASYRGISGTFDMKITIAEVDARAGCSGTSAFLAQAVIFAGTGTVSFGRPAA